MPTRPHNPGLPPGAKFRRGNVTYRHRVPDGSIRHISVSVDFPPSVVYRGRRYYETGRLGYRISDRVQAAEYEAADLAVSSTVTHRVWLGERVWMAADGTVSPEMT